MNPLFPTKKKDFKTNMNLDIINVICLSSKFVIKPNMYSSKRSLPCHATNIMNNLF